MEPGGSERALAHLDGLRGLAAVVVACHHFACAFLPAAVFGAVATPHFEAERWIHNSPLQLLVAGNFAVCIFFVLSGYVLSHKFFVTGDVIHLQSGAVRRYFRLAGPIMAAVALGYMVYALGLTHHLEAARLSFSDMWLAKLWPGEISLVEAIKQGVYGAVLGRGDPSSINNVLWTMKIEFLGSFLTFGTLALVGRLRHRWWVYVVLGALFFKSYYLAFILGWALCDLNTTQIRAWVSHWVLWLGLGLGLVLGSLPLAGGEARLFGNFALPYLTADQEFVLIHILGAALVMLAVTRLPWLRRGLGTKGFRVLGRLSFSLYLVHIPLLGSLACWLLFTSVPRFGYAMALAMAFVAWALACALLAWVFERLIDRTSVRGSRQIWRRYFARTT